MYALCQDLSTCVRTKGLTDLVSSRPGDMAALWRPRPSGTRQTYKCRKIGNIGGGQTGPGRLLTCDNDVIKTIIMGVPQKLQDFHKILFKLWYFRDHLPRQVWIIGGPKHILRTPCFLCLWDKRYQMHYLPLVVHKRAACVDYITKGLWHKLIWHALAYRLWQA